ncbi:hypothetical protein TNCV_1788271, partial [Trichonephila clavipes]
RSPQHRSTPPPITIDNVKLPNQLLKKLPGHYSAEDESGRNGRQRPTDIPGNPGSYHAIRKYVETEELEAFNLSAS